MLGLVCAALALTQPQLHMSASLRHVSPAATAKAARCPAPSGLPDPLWRVPAVHARLVAEKVEEKSMVDGLARLVKRSTTHTKARRGLNWRALFDSLDREHSGTLGVSALQEAVCAIDPACVRDRPRLAAIVRRFDGDDDGRLTYAEFEHLLTTVLKIPHDAVVLRSSPIAQPERYTTASIWLSSLLNIGGSQVLLGIITPLLAISMSSVFVALVHAICGSLPGAARGAGKALVQMHSLLGGALSLLLVFRTNSAYNRFWEARRIWESVLNRCRDLGRFLHLYRDEAGQKRVAFLVSMLCAFPRELRGHLVGEDAPAGGGRGRRGSENGDGYSSADATALEVGYMRASCLEAARSLSPPVPPHVEARVRRAGNRPMHVCKWLASEFKAIPDSDTFSSRERLMAVSQVNQLGSYVGACERLLQTPVPLNYARHTSRFLTLWCLTLPLSLVESMGFWVVPVTAFVTWCLFGIQEIGLFIEHCALDDGAIFMDSITELVALDVTDAVAEEEPLHLDDDDIMPRPQPILPHRSAGQHAPLMDMVAAVSGLHGMDV